MAGQFLINETAVTASGETSPLSLADLPATDLLLTLGITKVIEQQGLTVALQGSTDGGATWLAKPVLAFPQKFYTGVSTLLTSLSAHAGLTHVRAQWKVVRWGRGEKTPRFTFYLFAEPHER